MPLEGHWRTVNTPLRRLTRRERNVVIVGVVITLAALAALILATAGDSRPTAQPGSGCIETVVAGRVGGEPVNGCGARAEAICAHAAQFDDQRADTIVAECSEKGVPTTGDPGGPFSAERLLR